MVMDGAARATTLESMRYRCKASCVLGTALLFACAESASGTGDLQARVDDVEDAAGADSTEVLELSPSDAASSYGFSTCNNGQCLHNCRPYPRDPLVLDEQVRPLADLYCEDNSNLAPGEVCETCPRSAVLRVERRPDAGALDLRGPEGPGITVEYSDAGTWPVLGPGLEVLQHHCYRSAARIVLSNGYEANWSNGSWVCF